jgi:hypothetical protein
MTELDGTLKEVLRQMEKNADERHSRIVKDIDEVKGDVKGIRTDVTSLQAESGGRAAVASARRSSLTTFDRWVGLGLAALTVLTSVVVR